MAKVKTAFFCKNCGTQYSKWQGQCHACKEWNTIAEEILQKSKTEPWQAPKESLASIPIPIEEVSESQQARLATKDVRSLALAWGQRLWPQITRSHGPTGNRAAPGNA